MKRCLTKSLFLKHSRVVCNPQEHYLRDSKECCCPFQFCTVCKGTVHGRAHSLAASHLHREPMDGRLSRADRTSSKQFLQLVRDMP